MQTKIQKWGNSLGLRIPKSFAEQTGVNAGSRVDLSIIDGDLVVRPRRPPRYLLKDLLEAVDSENLHREIDTGIPVGRESW